MPLLAMKALTKGVLTYLWPAAARLRMLPDSTDYARYGYSVWLRHLVLAYQHGLSQYPRVILELGPGTSLGVGLAALVSGAVRYYALDIERGLDVVRELDVFDGIVELFRSHARIPGPEEFPQVQPFLESWDFPAFLFEGNALAQALSPSRLRALRLHVSQLEYHPETICYVIGEDAARDIPEEAIDFIISQAVMERVDDLRRGYRAIAQWLKPGGFSSHSVDFGEPLTSTFWNGNWARSDFVWTLMRGRHASWSNREPYSVHIRHMNAAGLRIVKELVSRDHGGLPRNRLAARYRNLDDKDLLTRGAYILAVKPQTT